MADEGSKTTIDTAGQGGGTGSTGPAEAAGGVAKSRSDDTGGHAQDQEAGADAPGGGEEQRASGVGASGAGSATGDASAARSESGSGNGLGGPDAGSPGGMDGVHARGGTGTERPPGGVSPIQDEEEG